MDLKRLLNQSQRRHAYVRHISTLSYSFNNVHDIYIEMAEIFPIDLKLDYKPRRVDYRALKEGKTIELMNFFHFDGAEMTLRHITLAGVRIVRRLVISAHVFISR